MEDFKNLIIDAVHDAEFELPKDFKLAFRYDGEKVTLKIEDFQSEVKPFEFETFEDEATGENLLKFPSRDPYTPNCYGTAVGEEDKINKAKLRREIRDAQTGDYFENYSETGYRTGGVYQVIVDKNGQKGIIDLSGEPDDYGTINPFFWTKHEDDIFEEAYWHNDYEPVPVTQVIGEYSEPTCSKYGSVEVEMNGRTFNIGDCKTSWSSTDPPFDPETPENQKKIQEFYQTFKKRVEKVKTLKNWYDYVSKEYNCFGFLYAMGVDRDGKLCRLILDPSDMKVRKFRCEIIN